MFRGQKQGNARFQAFRLPDYPVPKKLLDLVLKYPDERDKFNLIEELKVAKRSLFTNLVNLLMAEVNLLKQPLLDIHEL